MWTTIVKHDSWPIQPDILSQPLLRLTSKKPLWLDLQPVDIKGRWRYNWKSAQVVNSHLVCDPTIRQPGFDLPRQQWSLFLHRTGTLQCLQKEMMTYRHWSVSLWQDSDDVPHCRILSRQNWMAAYLGYTLRMKMLFRGWPVMVNETHTRRRLYEVWSVDSAPDPAGGAYSAPPDHLAGFKGAYF